MLTLKLGTESEPSIAFYLGGTWMNLFLFVLELLVGSYYFFNGPGKKSKVLMALSLLCDTVGTICGCWIAWMSLLNALEQDAVLAVKTNWTPYMILSLMTAASALFEQSYFAFRLWKIDRSTTLALFLTIPILASFICLLVAASLALQLGPEVDQERSANLDIAAILLLAITDVLISVFMVYKLRSIDSPKHPRFSKSFVLKGLAYAVSCGCITALTTTVGAVLTFVSPGGFILFADCTGRVYTLTILLNFVFFHEWRSDNDTRVATNTRQTKPWSRSGFRIKSSRLPTSTHSRQSTVSAMPKEASDANFLRITFLTVCDFTGRGRGV
ncbi:hypothetical protein BT96DRAFT_1004258 [Gymnopus androsaceus JB14]|uniref:DUF6534 domain-containing protein n=1 Tax=Gymnopus androsaceus JB14 TaxID=1447944 RepID=A0A6A4GSR7_9AGAR|nr:hypothetical protein BT96DRAFT_1004258 [Gymnopus androsaceus JB14]